MYLFTLFQPDFLTNNPKMKELTWMWWIKMLYLNLGIIKCVWCTALCYILIRKVYENPFTQLIYLAE
jgi:hypothetical protein